MVFSFSLNIRSCLSFKPQHTWVLGFCLYCLRSLTFHLEPELEEAAEGSAGQASESDTMGIEEEEEMGVTTCLWTILPLLERTVFGMRYVYSYFKGSDYHIVSFKREQTLVATFPFSFEICVNHDPSLRTL